MLTMHFHQAQLDQCRVSQTATDGQVDLEDWVEIEQWFLNESVDEIADVSAEESQEITNNEGCTESINDFEDC